MIYITERLTYCTQADVTDAGAVLSNLSAVRLPFILRIIDGVGVKENYGGIWGYGSYCRVFQVRQIVLAESSSWRKVRYIDLVEYIITSDGVSV